MSSFMQGYGWDHWYQLGKQDGASGGIGMCPDTTAENSAAYEQGYKAGKASSNGGFGHPVSGGKTEQQALQKEYDADQRAPNLKNQDPRYAPLNKSSYPEDPGGPDGLDPLNFGMDPGFAPMADSIERLFGGLFD